MAVVHHLIYAVNMTNKGQIDVLEVLEVVMDLFLVSVLVEGLSLVTILTRCTIFSRTCAI